MRLSEFIDGFATKKLARVDVLLGIGHQHEINGVSSLRELLGSEKITGTIHWNYLLDEEQHTLGVTSAFTFYDARENHATRTEWRLYYSDNPVMAAAESGDLLVILRIRGMEANNLTAFVFRSGTSWERKASLLFGSFTDHLNTHGEAELKSRDVELAETALLEMLGLGREVSDKDISDLANQRFPEDEFPSTRDLAAFARESIGHLSLNTPDDKLEAWLRQEAQLFYAIENRIVGAYRSSFSSLRSTMGSLPT